MHSSIKSLVTAVLNAYNSGHLSEGQVYDMLAIAGFSWVAFVRFSSGRPVSLNFEIKGAAYNATFHGVITERDNQMINKIRFNAILEIWVCETLAPVPSGHKSSYVKVYGHGKTRVEAVNVAEQKALSAQEELKKIRSIR